MNNAEDISKLLDRLRSLAGDNHINELQLVRETAGALNRSNDDVIEEVERAIQQYRAGRERVAEKLVAAAAAIGQLPMTRPLGGDIDIANDRITSDQPLNAIDPVPEAALGNGAALPRPQVQYLQGNDLAEPIDDDPLNLISSSPVLPHKQKLG